MTELKCTVCGGGRAATAIAADLTFMGCRVNLFELDTFRKNIEPIVERGGIELTGKTQSGKTGLVKINRVTTNPKEAVEHAEIIMVATPAFSHEAFFDAFSPYLTEGQCILVNTGCWASLRLANMLKEKKVFEKVTLAEANIMPYLSDKIGPTQTHIYAIKQDIKLATFPAKKGDKIFDMVKLVYPQHRRVPNVLWTNFAAGNPSVHAPLTIPMAGIMIDRYKVFHFYDEATTPGARLAEAFDRERLNVAQKLGCDVENIFDWIQKTYGYSGKDLSDSFRRSPHAERWVPQERHRAMIEEDILFFYIPMVEIGDSIDVPTPVTRGIIEIMGVMMEENYWERGITLEELGLTGLSVEQIVKYVNTGQK